MKAGWKIKKLGEVCQFINGRAYKKAELLDKGKYPVLRVGNFFTQDKWYFSDLELPENKYCDNGDLLYAWSASFGPRIWQGKKVIYHYHIWKIIENANLITKEFLYFLLDWDTDNLKEKYGTGTTMTHVGKGSIESREVPLPPLPEQHRIVAILDEAFAGIVAAKENAEQNLKNAKEVFEGYILNIFSDIQEKNGTRRLEEICGFQNGFAFKSKLFRDNGLPILRISNIQNNKVDTDKIVFFNIDDYKENLDKYKVNKNDLLIAMSGGTTGKIGFNTIDKIFYLNQRVGKFEPKKCLSKRYLFYFLSTRVEENLRISLGSAQPNLSTEQIKNFKIPFPSIQQQQIIVDNIDDITAETSRLESLYQQKLSNLEELKKSLLQQAFSGAL
jgi:type I restriction enzyme, S subunit